MPVVKDKYRGSIEYALVYSELITAARYRGTVTYQEIAKMMGLALSGNYMQSLIGQVLGEIAEDEVMRGRPMLSAIAVGVNGKPGPGLYTLAKELGRLNNQADEDFWVSEKKALYQTWKVKLREEKKDK